MGFKQFTYKTEKGEGRFASFYAPHHYIKLEGISIGNIVHDTWEIRFRVMKTEKFTDNNTNCAWIWITLGHKPASLIDAKIWLRANAKRLQEKYQFPVSEG